jgi:hypothetical protein
MSETSLERPLEQTAEARRWLPGTGQDRTGQACVRQMQRSAVQCNQVVVVQTTRTSGVRLLCRCMLGPERRGRLPVSVVSRRPGLGRGTTEAGTGTAATAIRGDRIEVSRAKSNAHARQGCVWYGLYLSVLFLESRIHHHTYTGKEIGK